MRSVEGGREACGGIRCWTVHELLVEEVLQLTGDCLGRYVKVGTTLTLTEMTFLKMLASRGASCRPRAVPPPTTAITCVTVTSMGQARQGFRIIRHQSTPADQLE